jgi:hypothetical protein
VGLLGRVDFLYVADCKLCSREAMSHIHRRGGRFLTVLPASRAEDRQFRDWLVDHDPGWVEACRRPPRLQADPDEVWWTATPPWPSAEGYRMVWVKSSSKVDRDAEARRDRIARGIAALDQVNTRLASPKTRIKTTVAAEQAAAAALEQTGATRWITFHVTEHTQETLRQEKRGRPRQNTRYRKLTRRTRRPSSQSPRGLLGVCGSRAALGGDLGADPPEALLGGLGILEVLVVVGRALQ